MTSANVRFLFHVGHCFFCGSPEMVAATNNGFRNHSFTQTNLKNQKHTLREFLLLLLLIFSFIFPLTLFHFLRKIRKKIKMVGNFIDDIDCGSFFDQIDDLLDFPADENTDETAADTSAVAVSPEAPPLKFWSVDSDSLPAADTVFSVPSMTDLSAELSVPVSFRVSFVHVSLELCAHMDNVNMLRATLSTPVVLFRYLLAFLLLHVYRFANCGCMKIWFY